MYQIEELDRMWIVSLLAEGLDTYEIVKNYPITEEVILESQDLLDKKVLLIAINFTQTFLDKALEIGYFNLEDLGNLSMITYANLDTDFIQKYGEYLNWKSIITFVSTQTDEFDKYLEVIEKENLWNVISANDLPISFIRQNKDKLDWMLLSMAKCFTEEEKVEFSEFIVQTKRELTDEELGQFTSFNPLTDYEKNYSVDEIADIIDKYMQQNNKDFLEPKLL